MKHTSYYVKFTDTNNKSQYRGPHADIFAAYIDMKKLGENIVIKRIVIEEKVDFEKELLKLGIEQDNIKAKIDILNEK